MEVIHISEAEATRDFAGVLERVRAGSEVVVESGAGAVARIQPIAPHRTISASLALAEAHSVALGYRPSMDPDYAADMEDIIRNRKPRGGSAWA